MKKRMAALLGALTLGLGLLAGCTNTAGAGADAGGSGLPNAANGTLDPNEPITITHRNIVAAASALALEYAVKCVSPPDSTAGIPT